MVIKNACSEQYRTKVQISLQNDSSKDSDYILWIKTSV